jgi:twinkle protein
MTAHELAMQLATRAEEVSRFLLPNGKIEGREFIVGSVNGEAGQSLRIALTGNKAGIWCDFADPSQKGDLLDLWACVRNVPLHEAIGQAKNYLGINDASHYFPAQAKKYRKPAKPPCRKPSASQKIDEYLTGHRQLTPETIEVYKLGAIDRLDWYTSHPQGPWIVFPSLREGELIFAKYLNLDRPAGKKLIVAESQCEPILFGWQAIPKEAREIVICEGEIDAMTLHQYGYPALSLPFGGGTGEKHRWIESEFVRLEPFDRIYLCMDEDEEGQAAAKEIANRLGLYRCYPVHLPRKDANECLTKGIPKLAIDECFAKAQPLDPEELRKASDFQSRVMERFYPRSGKPPGFDPPWKKLSHFRMQHYWLTLWGGINGHGKSLILGQLLLAAAEQEEKALLASFEMTPERSLERMVRQRTHCRVPTKEAICSALDWMDGKVWLFDYTGTAKAARVMEVCEYAYQRYGITQFVIDSLMKLGFAEDDYAGQKAFVDKLTDLKNRLPIHIHLVVHLRKRGSELEQPDKMDIRGSGAICDLADNLFFVWRNKKKERAKQAFDEGVPPKGITREEVERENDVFIICEKCRDDGEKEQVYGLMYDADSMLAYDESESYRKSGTDTLDYYGESEDHDDVPMWGSA